MSILDGRQRRSFQRRKALIDAYREIVRHSRREPTAFELAERVNCSPRTVFERFGSLGALSAAVLEELIEACHPSAVHPWVEHERRERIRLHVAHRARTCETWADLWRLALRQQGQADVLDQRLGEVRQFTREGLERLFKPELATLPHGLQPALLVALETLVDFPAWERLREIFAPPEAVEAWVEAIDRLLPATPRQPA